MVSKQYFILKKNNLYKLILSLNCLKTLTLKVCLKKTLFSIPIFFNSDYSWEYEGYKYVFNESTPESTYEDAEKICKSQNGELPYFESEKEDIKKLVMILSFYSRSCILLKKQQSLLSRI